MKLVERIMKKYLEKQPLWNLIHLKSFPENEYGQEVIEKSYK